MASTIFSDEIVNLTELRKRQKHWLEKAYHHPITIPYKEENLAIINRTNVGRLLEQAKYVAMLIEYWNEIRHRQRSKVFPWVDKLDKREQKEFQDELLDTVVECMEKEDWTQFAELLEDWKATAEAKENPDLQRILKNRTAPEYYVTLDG